MLKYLPDNQDGIEFLSASGSVDRFPSPEAHIEHGVNGLLVPPGDAQSLGDAIQDLNAHPGQITSLGTAA